MIETLYKTDTPQRGLSECYVLVLTSRPASNHQVHIFMEEHGYWDHELTRFAHRISSINTEDDMTYEAAFAMYVKAKDRLANLGFIHSVLTDHRIKRPEQNRTHEAEALRA